MHIYMEITFPRHLQCVLASLTTHVHLLWKKIHNSECCRIYILKTITYIQHLRNFTIVRCFYVLHSWDANLFSHFTVHSLLYLTIHIPKVQEFGFFKKKTLLTTLFLIWSPAFTHERQQKSPSTEIRSKIPFIPSLHSQQLLKQTLAWEDKNASLQAFFHIYVYGLFYSRWRIAF